MNHGIKIFIYLLLQLACSAALAVEGGETFKDWKVQCMEGDSATDNQGCHIFQNLVDKEGKKRVLHIAIGYVRGRENPAAIITLPLGISLPHGITINVDTGEAKKNPFQACFKTGCQAGFPLGSELMEEFRAGSNAMVTIYDLGQRPVRIPVSLNGFSAAIDAIKPEN